MNEHCRIGVVQNVVGCKDESQNWIQSEATQKKHRYFGDEHGELVGKSIGTSNMRMSLVPMPLTNPY